MTKRIGPKTLPSGTPEVTVFVLDDCPSTTTFCDLLAKKISIYLYIFPRIPYPQILLLVFYAEAYQKPLKNLNRLCQHLHLDLRLQLNLKIFKKLCYIRSIGDKVMLKRTKEVVSCHMLNNLVSHNSLH